MHRLASSLFALSLLIGGARLFTGVIYLADEPTALLVLKRAPATWIERPETPDAPPPRPIVLDREEPALAYGWIYLPLMRAAPALVPGLIGAALLLLIASGRPRTGTRR